jgi:hypothetical protein
MHLQATSPQTIAAKPLATKNRRPALCNLCSLSIKRPRAALADYGPASSWRSPTTSPSHRCANGHDYCVVAQFFPDAEDPPVTVTRHHVRRASTAS